MRNCIARYGRRENDGAIAFGLVSHFAAMADCEDHGFSAVIVIEGNVGTLSKFDDPFPKFGRHFLDGAANLGMSSEHLNSLPDGCDGALGCVLAFSSEEVVEALDIQQGAVRPS